MKDKIMVGLLAVIFLFSKSTLVQLLFLFLCHANS